MNVDGAISAVRNQIPMTNYLKKSQHGRYCCPYCNSGNGAHQSGALEIYNDGRFFCHKCHAYGDIIDLYIAENNVDFKTALSLLADEINISVEWEQQKTEYKNRKSEKRDMGQNCNIKDNVPDYTDYYNQCKARLDDPSVVAYLQRRGISLDIARQYNIGYDPMADPAAAPGGNGEIMHPTPRLILPSSDMHYVGRAISQGYDKRFEKINSKGSKPAIFNSPILNDPDITVIYVCEGIFDALSVAEIGETAVALNSASNTNKFIEEVVKSQSSATMIICMDNDDAGRNASNIIHQGLQRNDIKHIVSNICGDYKDPNEFLQNDRDGFTDAVLNAKQQASSKPDNVSYYIDNLMAIDILSFQKDVSTGFATLDNLSGGLYSGFYVLAAITSAGKTTFLVQLSDQLAAAGHDVLYFTLEQSRLELVSKSIARTMVQFGLSNKVSSLDVRRMSPISNDIIKASEIYKSQVKDRINIIEGNFNCDISYISRYVRNYVRSNGVAPIVCIDYLQLLQPEVVANGKLSSTTKETVDSAVTQLKRLSRELNITIIAISSVNRANYLTTIDLECLKESGNIEYTADVIWGLQLHQMLEDDTFNKTQGTNSKRQIIQDAKKENPRKLDLICLKNRFGIANYKCNFLYYTANDLFVEANFP